MAKQYFWIGSFGPYIYDDTDQYPDGQLVKAFRGTGITSGGTVYTTNTTSEAVAGAYPIGAFFHTSTVSSISPDDSSLLGFGTWSYIGTRYFGGVGINVWKRTA